MSRRFASSRRPLRYELYSLVSVMAFPLALALCFPSDALSFVQAPARGRRPAPCAFVTLNAEEADKILQSARKAWSVNPAGVRRMRADLSFSEIPDEEPGAIAQVADRLRYPQPGAVVYGVSPLPPSLAAPPPRRLAADPDEPGEAPPAFPRAELLDPKLD